MRFHESLGRPENKLNLPLHLGLVDMKTFCASEGLPSGNGKALTEEVRKYHLPDFSNWKSLRTATNAAFARAFAPLEKDLRTSIGK